MRQCGARETKSGKKRIVSRRKLLRSRKRTRRKQPTQNSTSGSRLSWLIEGMENDVQEESRGLLFDSVEYIKKHKCVALEDLAAEFSLRTQECINQVVALEQMGRITGVMDDRGKFIYISPEEMTAVADYIKRLGCVSIAQLANKSNEFIDVESKTLETDIISCAEEMEEPSPSFELLVLQYVCNMCVIVIASVL